MGSVTMTTPATYLTRAAEKYGVSVDAIKSGSRKAAVAAARRAAVVDLRQKYRTRAGKQMSMERIGMLCGVSRFGVFRILERADTQNNVDKLYQHNSEDTILALKQHIRSMSGHDTYLDMSRAYNITPAGGLILSVLCVRYPHVVSSTRFLAQIQAAFEVSGITSNDISPDTLKVQISKLKRQFLAQGLPPPIERVGQRGITLSQDVAGILHYRFGLPAKLVMEVA